MNIKLSVICFTALMGCSSINSVQAQDKEQVCDTETILLVAEKLKLKGIEEGNLSKNPWLVAGLEGVKAAACKVSPQDKDLMYVTLASNPRDNKNVEGQIYYDFTIATINTKNKNVVASYKSKLEEDATLRVDQGTLRIDTANYRLNDKTRAFGVDVVSGYIANCADGGFGPIRTLYIQEGKKIRPILEGMIVSSYMNIVPGPSRCNSDASEDVVKITEEHTTSISMANTMTNGFKDIVVNTKTRIVNGLGGREFSSSDRKALKIKAKPTSGSHTISYNGLDYNQQQ